MKSHDRHPIRWHASIGITFVLLALIALVTPAAVAQQSNEDFRQQSPLLAGGSVTVENGRGEVQVEGWDRAEILVEGHKYFEGNESYRADWLRDTKIRVEGDEHHRFVKVEYPNFTCWFDCWGSHGVNLKIHVPRQVNADLKADRGHVTVQQIAGKLEISNDRGNTDITNLDGELRVQADRGNLKVRDTVIRNGIRVSMDRGSADIELRQFAGTSNLEASRGDLTLTLPKNAAFTLDAERNRRSEFRTDFPVLARGNFDGDRIRGDVNGGGAMLRLRGERGTVRLRAAQ